MGTKASSAQGLTCSEWPGWEGRQERGGRGARPGSSQEGRLAETLDCSCDLGWKNERQTQSTCSRQRLPSLPPIPVQPVLVGDRWFLRPRVFRARDLPSVAAQTSSWARGRTIQRSAPGPARCQCRTPPSSPATCHPALSLCPRGLSTGAVALPKAVQLTTDKGTRCLGIMPRTRQSHIGFFKFFSALTVSLAAVDDVCSHPYRDPHISNSNL